MRVSWSLGHWLPLLRTIEDAPASVALSVDDGPTPETTPHLIALLRKFDGRATFFLSGVRVVRFPELVAEIVQAGHDVFAHGWEHIRLDRAGAGEPVAAMEKCEALLRAHRPTPAPYLVRLPYGGGYRNPRVHRDLKRWNPSSQMAHYRLSFHDYLLPPLCPTVEDIPHVCREAVARTLAVGRLPGSILLCHDNPFDVVGEHKALVTIAVMKEVLTALRTRGLTAVPIRQTARRHAFARFVLV